MPRYFFRLVEFGNASEDPDGLILADHSSVRERAVREARSIMSADVREGQLSLGGYIEVDDEQGSCVACVSFREAVQLVDL